MYTLTLYKNTHFGHDELVWNIPSKDHNFNQYSKKVFPNILKRIPLLATSFVVNGKYTDDLKECDYLTLKETATDKVRYYFIESIAGERNIILLSVILDTLSTFELLDTPINGTLIRKHSINKNETPFDYPTALSYVPNYESYDSKVVGYSKNDGEVTFIESSVDLTSIPTATTIKSDLLKTLTLPVLKRPPYETGYAVELDGVNVINDSSGALTLFLSHMISPTIIDTLRGVSGDGAISDKYTLPGSAFDISTDQNNISVRGIRGKVSEINTGLVMSSSPYLNFRNKAIEGMARVEISSLTSGDMKSFPAWTLKESLKGNKLHVKLWNNPKPSGNPYCCPLKPPSNMVSPVGTIDTPTLLGILLKTSVVGSQWLKNPLIYTSGKGEILASVETELQREKSAFEHNQAMVNLDISQREKQIRIAQQKYNYEASQTMGVLNVAGDLLSGDFGGAIGGVASMHMDRANQQYIRELQALKSFEGSSQSHMISIAHRNNLRSLDIQENIRRIVAPELVIRGDDSLKTYTYGNHFRVDIVRPDDSMLIAKDLEYTLYGYPVFETVYNYNMSNNLRVNHSVFQFINPSIDIGGEVGDITKEFLQAGIRILSNKYTKHNLLQNPKR